MYGWVNIFSKYKELTGSFFRIIDTFELHVSSLNEKIPIFITLYECSDGTYWARSSHYPVDSEGETIYEFPGSTGSTQEEALDNLFSEWNENLKDVPLEKREWIDEEEHFQD